jgi:Peptidase A4 family
MAISRSGQSEATQKIREALRVRLFTPPPENFDPVKASDDELREYGYPTRPDIDLYPELHERWEQIMSRPMLFIEPQFAVTPNWRLSRRQDLAAPTGQNWSGSIAYPPDGDKVTFVSGQWTVPAIVAPKSYFGWYSCATWIGIDGGPQGGLGGPNYFVQAGTVQEGDLFGTKTYPWFEWPPHGPMPLSLS